MQVIFYIWLGVSRNRLLFERFRGFGQCFHRCSSRRCADALETEDGCGGVEVAARRGGAGGVFISILRDILGAGVVQAAEIEEVNLFGGRLLRDEVPDGFVLVMGHTREVIEHRYGSLPWRRAVELHIRADQLIGMDRGETREALAGDLEDLTAPERAVGAVTLIIEADAEHGSALVTYVRCCGCAVHFHLFDAVGRCIELLCFSVLLPFLAKRWSASCIGLHTGIHRVEDRAVTLLHPKHRHPIVVRKDFSGVGRRELRIEIAGDAIRLLLSLIEGCDDLCSEALPELLRRFEPQRHRCECEVLCRVQLIAQHIAFTDICPEGDGDPTVSAVFF